ncbi:hypothetical protein D3C86_1742630 [compost metagenome]
MLCPSFFYITGFIWNRKIGSFYNVSQLENKSHSQALRDMQKQKADQKMPPAYIQH